MRLLLPLLAPLTLALVIASLRTTAPPAAGAAGVTAIAAAGQQSCAAISGGTLACWGSNGAGQLGNGDACDPCTTPVDVQGLGTNVGVAGGGSLHMCAVADDGGLRCWGDNGNGQLGDGTSVQRHEPVAVCAQYDAVYQRCVAALTGVAGVDGGATHTCALVGDAAQCWGNNRRAQLGRDCPGECPLPGVVTGLASGVVAIASGTNHACALLDGGGVRCWGDNDHGQLGNGTLVRPSAPVDVCAGGAQACGALLAGVRAIAAGGDHTCALLAAGALRCWGNNGHASITSGRICSPDCTTPAEVCLAYTAAPDPPGCAQPLDGVTAIAVGNDFECAIRQGRLLCWGDNDHAQLGVGDGCPTIVCTVPLEVCAEAACVTPFSGVSAVAVGWSHACAIASGAVRCWGTNAAGQLGQGDAPEPPCECRSAPAAVAGLPSVAKTPPSGTPTPPRPPTATPSATTPCGDVNNDGLANSVDAAVILQYEAGLFQTFRELDHADVNRDGAANSIDASLILQHEAGRLPRLNC